MCTSPLHLKNPSKIFRPGESRFYLDVPCGKCPDCRASQSQEWFVRTWAEIDNCLARGGFVVFVTLTYDLKHRPRFSAPDLDVFGIPCFNKQHIQHFIKGIRRSLSRQIYGIERELDFKYVFFSEFGLSDYYLKNGELRRGQHAPHYHGLLFFGPRLREHLTNNFSNTGTTAVKQLVQRCWPYGMVRWSKSEANCGKGIFVKSSFAAQYCSKYAVKDVDFYCQPDVDAFIKNPDGSRNYENYDRIKPYLPFHLQSEKFGISLVDKLSIDVDNLADEFNKGMRVDIGEEIADGKSKRYKIPRYVERALLYDRHGTRFVLNQLGYEVKSALLGCRINDLVDKFERVDTELLKEKILHNADYVAIDPYHSNRESLQNYMHSLINGRSLVEVALYSLVWKDKLTGRFEELQQIDSCNLQDFFDLSYKKYFHQLETEVNLLDYHEYHDSFTRYFDIDDMSLKYDGLHEIYSSDTSSLRSFGSMRTKFKTYNKCDRFSGFDDYLRLVNKCFAIVRDNQQRAFDSMRIKKKEFVYHLSKFDKVPEYRERIFNSAYET